MLLLLPAAAGAAIGDNTRDVCTNWPSPACMTQVVTDAAGVTQTFASPPAAGLTPAQLHSAYELPTTAPAPIKVAVIAVGNAPTAEADLGVYSAAFGLPPCTVASGCLTRLNQAGQGSPMPPTDAAWAQQTSTDLQLIHAICQNCQLLLVQANSRTTNDIIAAVNQAEAQGAKVISSSFAWGGEPVRGDAVDKAYTKVGTVMTASAGNTGMGLVNFPAVSPNVVAVGGTELSVGADGSYAGESAWESTATFCAHNLRAAAFPSLDPVSRLECDFRRAVADVAAVADPHSPVAIYDSTPDDKGKSGWQLMGGTGVANPIIAAAYALAGGAHNQAFPAESLYLHEFDTPSPRHDVTTGNNTPPPYFCQTLICQAAAGWDHLTGVGTPKGLGLFVGSTDTAGTTPVTPTDLVNGLSYPDGIVTDSAGNIYVTSATLFGQRLSKFAPDGSLIKQVAFGGPAVGDGGRLERDPLTGTIWNMSHYGQLRTIDPVTLAVTDFFNVTSIPPSTIPGRDHVWDTSLHRFWDMTASIQPFLSNFGDFALRRSDGNHQIDFWLTAQTSNQNTYYVLRVRFRDGVFQSAAPVVGAIVPNVNSEARGIAVSKDGTVVTTLPIASTNPESYGQYDALIGFSPDMPAGNEEPQILLGGHDQASRGMTTDSQGNIYITGLITSTWCGVSGGAITVLTPKREFNRCYPYGFLSDGLDIAVSDDGSHVYETIGADDPLALPGRIIEWPRLAALTIRAKKTGAGTGTITSSPPGINCGIKCSSGFEDGEEVTLHATPAAGSGFTGWSGAGCSGTGDCTITMSSDADVVAGFSDLRRSLTVYPAGAGQGTITGNPGAISCPGTCSGSFSLGSQVTLHAAPAAGSRFTGWSGGGCTGTGDCVVTMSSARSVSAFFEPIVKHQLTVSRTGAGSGTVTSTPAAISCGGTCSAQFDEGTLVTLHAAPASGSLFSGWSGGGCSGTGDCTVTIAAATSVTAAFAKVQRELSVTTAGAGSGTVTSTPAAIQCPGTCTAQLDDGLMVTLHAAPAADSSFTGWSGACTGTGDCVVTMSAARAVTAGFAKAQRLLTITASGSGQGSVTSVPVGITCPGDCSQSYEHGTSVTLQASPAAGSLFSGWSGGGCSGTSDCVVSMDQARNVVATFTLITRLLNVVTSGSGTGSVTSSPAGIACPAGCSFAFAEGLTVTLHATPAGGSSFSGWSGAGCSGLGDCMVSLNSDKAVTATFTLITRTLTVTLTGSGGGIVTSSPASISCPGACVGGYPHGTAVTLHAAPAAGSSFAGWSGACTGTADCALNMSSDVALSAGFEPSAPGGGNVTGGGGSPGGSGPGGGGSPNGGGSDEQPAPATLPVVNLPAARGTLKVTASGKLSVPRGDVRCPAAADGCKATFVIRSDSGASLGQGSFRVPRGGVMKAVARLSSQGLRRLRRSRRLTVRVTFSLSDGTNVVTRKVTLRARAG